jgi:hypothetical protein
MLQLKEKFIPRKSSIKCKVIINKNILALLEIAWGDLLKPLASLGPSVYSI